MSDQPITAAATCTPSTTHNTHKRKNIHALSRIQTRDPTLKVAADVCLRPDGCFMWVNKCFGWGRGVGGCGTVEQGSSCTQHLAVTTTDHRPRDDPSRMWACLMQCGGTAGCGWDYRTTVDKSDRLLDNCTQTDNLKHFR